ncbi:hypothetical protein FB567DRAFT_546239 [Paraphoma chrysanthemicola]|uniref:Uncharacterized protein n=1 Tax=Paraphoma chrysanthemicola TaxID=798071 RepID=A0A8K0W215_9PLEO|nr:hypothetical protein FB567DRAFT_546239 [Paraphoma chrysanthemicola]
MKLILIVKLSALFILTTAEILLICASSNLYISQPGIESKGVPLWDPSPQLGGDPIADPNDPTLSADAWWDKAVCRGNKSILAMTLSREEAAKHVTLVDRPWVGDDLEAKLTSWGYKDDAQTRDLDMSCDFERTRQYTLQEALNYFGISNQKSWGEGGANKCFHLIHCDGENVMRGKDNKLPPLIDQRYKVGEKTYQVTDAHFKIGVDTMDGAMYFMDRDSPATAARDLWKRDPRIDELPDFRSSSDIACILWKRQTKEQKWDVKAIKRFFSCKILNKETGRIMARAIREWTPPGGKKPTGFQPYFLVQYKLELGNKYIPNVTIFCDDDIEGMILYVHMLFWVEDVPPKDFQPPPESKKPEAGRLIAKILVKITASSDGVKRSMEGNTGVRNHLFELKAKL